MPGFGDTLKKIRRAHGLSQRHLGMKYGRLQGKEDGISPSVVAGWESGARRPSREVIALLCESVGALPEERDELYLAAGFVPEHAESDTLAKVRAALRAVDDLPESDKQEIITIVEEIVKRDRGEQ